MTSARITGNAKLAGVIGWPITHSLSPAIHNYWLANYNIDGLYAPLNVHPDQLADVIRALPKMGFAGVNLTLPHKELVLPMLASIDATASAIGAVNTIIIRDGACHGTNTDAYGFIENIRPHLTGKNKIGKNKAVLLGAGGAAKAVAYALAQEGFAEIIICNRSLAKAEHLASHYPTAKAASWQSRATHLEGADLLINATSLGLAAKEPLHIDLTALPKTALVTDIVYTPLITPLLQAAIAHGNPTIDGLGMLLHQATPAFHAWFGHPPTITAALRETISGAQEN